MIGAFNPSEEIGMSLEAKSTSNKKVTTHLQTLPTLPNEELTEGKCYQICYDEVAAFGLLTNAFIRFEPIHINEEKHQE